MSIARRFALALVSGAALAGGVSGNALAADDSATLGPHVAACAQESLGQRQSPPTVTCTHNGMTMTFATFGELMEHMRSMHG